jgi:hypothetical protein
VSNTEATLDEVIEYFKSQSEGTWLEEAKLAAALGKDVKQALLLGLFHLNRDPELQRIPSLNGPRYALNR